MNINDLPKGSYQEVKPLNINSLPKGSFSDVPTQTQPKLSERIWSGVAKTASFFPGKVLGEVVGNNIHGLSRLAQGDVQGFNQAADAVGQIPLKRIAGDVTAAVLTPASMAISGPAGTGLLARAGRVATNTGVGATLGGADAAAEGGSITSGAQRGAAWGAGMSAGGEAASALLSRLPTWFTNKALPKLKDGNIEYALKTTKIGPIPKLLEQSDNSVASFGKQINSILEHPQYADAVGFGSQPIDDALAAFPDAQLTGDDVVDISKKVAPSSKAILDKVKAGTATLLEKNKLRIALDQATKKIFTDAPDVSFNKKVANALANALRNDVQSNAEETVPIFQQFTKEMDLNNALTSMTKTLRTRSAFGLYDIVAALGGFATLGPAGSVGAIAAEKALRSPGVNLAAAKGAQALQNAAPAIGAITKGVRPAIIDASIDAQTATPQPPQPDLLESPSSSTNNTLDDVVSANDDGTFTVKGPFSGEDFTVDMAVGGTLGKVSSKALEKIAKRIHKEDIGFMRDITDYVAKSYKPSAQEAIKIELDARRLWEHYLPDIHPPKTLKGIANDLGRLLDYLH